jgi:hypothetical protein
MKKSDVQKTVMAAISGSFCTSDIEEILMKLFWQQQVRP